MKKETKKNVISYLTSTLALYGCALIFSLFSLIFFIDKIPKVVQCIVSFVFMAPTFYMAFAQGRGKGDRLFKAKAKTTLNDIHGEIALEIPYHKCVFHVIGFVLPLTFLFVLATILHSTAVRFVGMLFTFPVALLFSSINVLDTSKVMPSSLAIFLPYIFLLAGTFVMGYIFRVRTLKRQHGNIENEIRMFDN